MSREEKFKEKLESHPGNIPGPNGRKTTLISSYKGRIYLHTFSCGQCGKPFDRVIDDMVREGRNCCCQECSQKRKANIFKIKMDEAQERIDNKFGKDKIEINEAEIINMRTDMSFYCNVCNKNFIKTLWDLLHSNGCIHCMPYGYSEKAIRWLKTLPNFNNIQHAKNGGEYIFPGTRWKLDGIDHKLKIIYEFHGCDFHGHCCLEECKRCGDVNKLNPYKIPYEEAYKKTLEKKNYFLALGYQYIEMWECHFDLIDK